MNQHSSIISRVATILFFFVIGIVFIIVAKQSTTVGALEVLRIIAAITAFTAAGALAVGR